MDTKQATLHLNYEIQKPGYRGYDRRHFPEHLTTSVSVYKPRGRQRINSPELEDVKWIPHGRHIEPKYSDIGPDWRSRLRYIPAPRNPNTKPTYPVSLLEQNLHYIRSYPQNWQQTTNEWKYFSDSYRDSSKRNLFSNIHLRSIEDLGDRDLKKMIGQKRRVFDCRNGLSQSTNGDKSYRFVEQSPDFYKFGCTLPAVQFGRTKSARESTCVLLNQTGINDNETFQEKQLRREETNLIEEVKQLDSWKPSDGVTAAFKVFDADQNDKNLKYRPRVR
ncbi:unnamed protein product [Didymodactylos carnosus]|uniref:Uncharacterized protein n=1 Tax=Didymodactylos carnosus TaxID=1234261 RepID=A0A813XLI3_9BILA|nr:unnamed protein product [Didymodactylos carnosus]CAF1037433.1 unnamed protein product [Didymodactylos carnosus]CAF3661882.1 unnamed protein product [Didymodactylos carnosus]CAF3805587.1 unnamed protein product [Didymodactylos carnosus]